MDPNDLIKAAPAIAKGAEALAAAIPFTAIVKRMLGPAADELAEMWRDQVRLYRYGRSLSMLKNAEKMAQEAGFTPQAVPIKLLFPLLEGASLEENEDLHDMWAALLANAASPENAKAVRSGFIGTLRQMEPDEAHLLNFIYNRHVLDGAVAVEPSLDGISDLGTCLDGLEAEQLVRRSDALYEDYGNDFPKQDHLYGSLPKSRAAVFAQRTDKTYVLTDRGRAFVEACRPPKPTENG